ncbi:MAG: O-methyltransferase [Paludibacteraceae bacterium]|nr:O-methyltransferase [Paludibacteraceae bacterium]
MTIEEYILNHIDEEPAYLAAINRNTWVRQMNPRMCSGHLQGRVLSMIARMIQPQQILEVGTFTGYSALCFAEALPENGCVDTIEMDDELEDFIRDNCRNSPYENKINLYIGDALEIIPSLEKMYDLVFLDAEKSQYTRYYDAVFPKVKNGGYILADNTIWDGKVTQNVLSNDLKTREIIRFNDLIKADSRVEKVILPLRDGLTIIRKK